MPDVHVARGVLTPELCAEIVPRFRWTGSLGPAGPGNRCTQGHVGPGATPAEDGSERQVFERLFIRLLSAGVLPLQLDEVESWRGWASSTPAGVPIAPHAHDADQVVCVYLQVPEKPEPLHFEPRALIQERVIGLRYVYETTGWHGVEPEAGLALQWPSSLEHGVPIGPARAGDRVAAVWNVTLRRAA